MACRVKLRTSEGLRGKKNDSVNCTSEPFKLLKVGNSMTITGFTGNYRTRISMSHWNFERLIENACVIGYPLN